MSLLPRRRGRALEQRLRRRELDEVTSLEALDLLNRKQDLQLRSLYARRMLGGLAAQIVIADGVFVAYAWAGKGWDLPPEAITAWLGATVIEVVGVVIIITRSLFPQPPQPAADENAAGP